MGRSDGSGRVKCTVFIPTSVAKKALGGAVTTLPLMRGNRCRGGGIVMDDVPGASVRQKTLPAGIEVRSSHPPLVGEGVRRGEAAGIGSSGPNCYVSEDYTQNSIVIYYIYI